MQLQRNLRSSSQGRILLTLLLVFASTASCWNSSTGSENRATNANTSANSGEAKQVRSLSNSNSPVEDKQPVEQPPSGKPGIKITDIPSRGAGPDAVERIAGTVSGVNTKECKVIIFAHTDTWYVQPYIASSDTTIADDGKWENDSHLGSEYAALLVKTSYKPPATTGVLPTTGGAVLAITIVKAKQ